MYQIENLLPIPLKDQHLNTDSKIWLNSYTLEKGNGYLVTSPSGKGKSTFLHILYGLRKDYDGNVFYNQKNIRDFSLDEWTDLRQHQLSIVFQDLRLFPNLTAWDNILLKAQLTQVKSEATIKTMAEQLGIHNLLNQACGILSYGQRQRVAIIRALCQPFSFLLLDEPFSHLDDVNTQNAFQLIKEHCKERQASFILVSLGENYGGVYDQELIL